MKVDKSTAAKMVGIGRTAFYRHIKSKPISVSQDGKIDVAELIRVYGNENVQSPEQTKTSSRTKKEQEGTHEDVSLREENVRLKKELELLSTERRREREQFSEEIENLRSNLKDSMDQNKKLTLLVTDQRESKNQESSLQTQVLKSVLEKLETLEASRKEKKSMWGFWK